MRLPLFDGTGKAEEALPVPQDAVPTLCAVSHQVHLAVRALSQLADELVVLVDIGAGQRVDG